MIPRIHVAAPAPSATGGLRAFSALARPPARPCRPPMPAAVSVSPRRASLSPIPSLFLARSALHTSIRFHNNYSPFPPPPPAGAPGGAGGVPPGGVPPGQVPPAGGGFAPGYIQPLPQQYQQFPQQPQQPKSKSKLWRRLTAVFFLLAGISFAGRVQRQYRSFIPPLIERGSPQEQEVKIQLAERINKTSFVQDLLEDSEWVEWHRDSGSSSAEGPAASSDASVDTVAESSSGVPRTRLTTGALGGVNGMTGYHRVFRNIRTGEIISIIWIGAALAGWPATAHGGALATILDEALGRCAIFSLPARTGVTARLELSYRRPVTVPGVYIVQCKPELAPADITSDLRKLWCDAQLMDLESRVCVQARALFVVPRGYNLGRVEGRF